MSRHYRRIVIVLGVVILVFIFILGVLGRIPWNYTAGAITLTGAIVALIKLLPLKVESDSKDVDEPISKEKMRNAKEQRGETEPVFSRVGEKQDIVFLSDGPKIANININNDLFDQLYEQAHNQAITIYDDATLTGLSIFASPFEKIIASVAIHLTFYSKSAGKTCNFIFSDKNPQVKYNSPDRFRKTDIIEKGEVRRYPICAHSLRKYIRTQLGAISTIPTDYIDYMMGRTISTYNDIKSNIPKLRELYASSGLSIRPKTKLSKLDHLRVIVVSMGLNPDEVLSKDALAKPHRTVIDPESRKIEVLNDALKHVILTELRNA